MYILVNDCSDTNRIFSLTVIKKFLVEFSINVLLFVEFNVEINVLTLYILYPGN